MATSGGVGRSDEQTSGISGSSRPTLRKLLNTRVIANASSRWYQLGIQLLDDDQVAQLENIKENNADVTERCTALFRYWLRMYPNASWYELVAAMRAPGVELNKLAVAVEENFTGQVTRQQDVVSVQPNDQTKQDDEEKLLLTRKQLDELIMKYTQQSQSSGQSVAAFTQLSDQAKKDDKTYTTDQYAAGTPSSVPPQHHHPVHLSSTTITELQSTPSSVSNVPSSSTTSSTTVTFAHFSTVSEAFAFLTSRLRSQLTKADFCDIKRVCIEQTQSPSGAQLPPELIEKVKSCEHINPLFDTLAESAYWSWIDIRLLNVMAAASGLLESIELLSSYKQAVFSRKLIDLLPNAPSKKVKEEYYSKLVTKINKDAKDITVAELLEFQALLEKVILVIQKGVCTVEHLESGCIEVHWYIPTHCVDSAYQSASTRCHMFNEIHLLWLQIAHYPVIHDPLTTIPVDMSTPPPPDRAATVKDFIDHYYDYLSVNMNTEVAVPLMISQQLLSEDVVMTAQSSYHKSCLILQQVRLMDTKTLMSFCQMLKASHSQHIGETLINALEATPVIDSAITDDTVEHAQQLGTAAIQQMDREDLHTVGDMFEPSSIVTCFFDMMAQLAEVLQSLSPKILANHCGILRASEKANIKLFQASSMIALKEIKSTPLLLHKLAPFTNWMDHSILTAVVEVCNVPEAAALLAQFDGRIDTSQPVTQYPIPSPSHQMVPYDTSTHTVLVVQLNLQLHQTTLQSVLNARSLIQEKCEVTPHCLQLLAVAKTSHTIIYWTIPKHVASLIISNVYKYQSYLYQNGIQQVAIYPGTILVTGTNVPTVGPFSFFAKATSDTSDSLKMQIYQLEEIPKKINTMQDQLLQTRKEHNATIKQLNEIAVQMDERITTLSQARSSEPVTKKSSDASSNSTKWSLASFDTVDTLKTIQSQQDQLIVQLRESKELERLLKEKIVKEKQKYSNLREQYKELQNTLPVDHPPELSLDTSQQEEDESLDKQEEMQSSQLQVLDEETQTELTKLQSVMENVSSSLEKVEVIMKYWSEKTSKSPQSPMKDQEKVKESSETLPLQSEKGKNLLQMQLKTMISNLSNVEEWSSFVQLLQTELSESKQKNDQLEDELTQTQGKVFKLQEEITRKEEENRVAMSQLSEKDSQLMMKDKELTKLKEDNKLLVKQFREKKDKRRRETIPQDQLVQQELLGSGRYGEAWRISYGDKTYAGKIIHKNLLPGYPDTSVDQINQFVADIENIYAIFGSHEHPNIEQYYTITQPTPDGPPILLSQLLPDNLNSFTAKMKGKLPIHVQLDLCLDMAKGVQYLHANGVIHNNLHAGNVLISQDGKAKIGDYICPQNSELNEKTTLQHKNYMSPELIKNTAICSRPSDIYSLGVLFIQVATQSTPTPTDSENTELSEVQRHKHQLYEITTNPLLPVIMQCLNILPGRPSIDQLCDRINTAKQSPQNVLSDTLHHVKESQELGLSLKSEKYKMKWIKCQDLPVPMRGAHGTVINDILYIGGGDCPDHNDSYYVFAYNLRENKWTKLPAALPQCYGVVVNINDVLSVIGGLDYNTGRPTNKVLTLEEDKWTTLYGDMKCARISPLVVPYHQYTIVAGGKGEDGVAQDSVEYFNTNTNQWTKSKTCLPQPMWSISATTCNNSIIITGYTGADNSHYNTTYITTIDSIVQSHDDNNKWSELCPTPYWYTTIVPHTTPPVIVGGQDRQYKAQDNIMLYDDTSNSWKTVGSLPIRCAQTTVVTLNNNIVIAGGCTKGGNVETANSTALTSVMIGQLDRV